jgi:hypothetical protein
MLDWKPFLTNWSKQLLQSDLRARIDPPPKSKGWLGFPRATKQQIMDLEQRLGLALPPSYRSFLQTTNGFLRTTPFIDRIRPPEEVDWFKTENEQTIEAYSQNDSDLKDEDYFDYARHAELHYRATHLSHLIQITDEDDGLYLLNPQAVTPDGEWEAWFFANWVPGFRRYPSFAHLMLAEYRLFTELQKISLSPDALPTLPIPSPQLRRIPAKGKRKNRKNRGKNRGQNRGQSPISRL